MKILLQVLIVKFDFSQWHALRQSRVLLSKTERFYTGEKAAVFEGKESKTRQGHFILLQVIAGALEKALCSQAAVREPSSVPHHKAKIITIKDRSRTLVNLAIRADGLLSVRLAIAHKSSMFFCTFCEAFGIAG